MNIIVNGGTRGIGKEVALILAQDINNRLVVMGRNVTSLKNLSDSHKNIRTISVDLSVFDSQSKAFKKVVNEFFNSIDILINVAGYLSAKDFMETENSDARKMMEINFFGPASVIRVVKPLMARGSHIVNISSMGGFQGSAKFKGLSCYSASKAAIACLSECLATEFADSGISVNCLALGAVQTEMLAKAFPGYKAPIDAKKMAEFISDFALNGHKFLNGKIIPVALNNP
jgi:NAD(P)-dependent dehydrogenase (short-subunit alcohol dehydrogenase family)